MHPADGESFASVFEDAEIFWDAFLKFVSTQSCQIFFGKIWLGACGSGCQTGLPQVSCEEQGSVVDTLDLPI